jgi:hypothetical protein
MNGWKERIQRAFIGVHGDTRDEVQVRASKEMQAALEKPVEPPLQALRKHIEEQFEKVRQPHEVPPRVEKSPLELSEHRVYDERDQQTFEHRAQTLARHACNVVHTRHRSRLSHRQHWFVGDLNAPAPDVNRLYEEALRSLGYGTEVETEQQQKKGAAA